MKRVRALLFGRLGHEKEVQHVISCCRNLFHLDIMYLFRTCLLSTSCTPWTLLLLIRYFRRGSCSFTVIFYVIFPGMHEEILSVAVGWSWEGSGYQMGAPLLWFNNVYCMAYEAAER